MTKATISIRLGVAILAAGASSRMGRPKLLLPWASGTVLGHLLGVWQRLGAEQVAVVMAPDALELGLELDRLGVNSRDRILNTEPHRGMFSSVQSAARWAGWRPGLTHWVLTLGDQPHVREETLRQLLELSMAEPACICQPARAGRPRHPVVLPKLLFAELARCGDNTLKEFLVARTPLRRQCEINDDALDFDLDEPADYEKARRWVGL